RRHRDAAPTAGPRRARVEGAPDPFLPAPGPGRMGSSPHGPGRVDAHGRQRGDRDPLYGGVARDPLRDDRAVDGAVRRLGGRGDLADGIGDGKGDVLMAAEGVTLGAQWMVLWRRRWLIAIVCLVVCGGTVALTLRMPRIYESTATLLT